MAQSNQMTVPPRLSGLLATIASVLLFAIAIPILIIACDWQPQPVQINDRSWMATPPTPWMIRVRWLTVLIPFACHCCGIYAICARSRFRWIAATFSVVTGLFLLLLLLFGYFVAVPP
jgi:hypothetical protein